MDNAKLLMRKAIVLLGHRNSLKYRAERAREDYAHYEKQLVEYKKRMEKERLSSRDIHAEIFDVNNVLAEIFKKVPILRNVEFMDMLYNADKYTEMDTDLRVNDILAEFQFNGKV